VIAYEPVWAIGTGRNATDAQAQEVHAFIRESIGKMWNRDFAQRVRIQYGGSMKPDNAKSLMNQPDVDGGLVGGARLAWPDDAAESEPPAWLVFGATIRTVAMTESEPGLRPLGSALEDEGFDDLGSGRLVESFARHLMVAIDTCQDKGFGEIAKSYLARLAHPISLSPTNRGASGVGLRHDIDQNGDLLVRRMGKAQIERHSLVAALAMPSWLDPASGGPRA